MDFKRLMVFFSLALLILLGWEQMFPARSRLPHNRPHKANSKPPRPITRFKKRRSAPSPRSQ